MKIIITGRGDKIKISDRDFPSVSKHIWSSFPSDRTFYAHSRIGGKMVMLHRFILGDDSKFLTDHKNGNGLDCRRSNIRRCTHSQNQWNARKSTGKVRRFHSKFKGVAMSSGRSKPWMVRIRKFRKTYYIGNFSTQIEAAIAYNKAAKRLHGRFASINVIPNQRMKEGEL